MDAPATQATIDIGSALLKITVGVIIAILGAILYDMNERLKYLERNCVTPDMIKESMREVMLEPKAKR